MSVTSNHWTESSFIFCGTAQPVGHFVFSWATLPVYGRPPVWFHRIMHRLLLGAKWVPANA